MYGGRASAFHLRRDELDRLRGLPNSSDAIALWIQLVDSHGHAPAKEFALNWRGMKAAGLTDLSDRRFLAARRTLEDAGLLVPAKNHRRGHHSRTYRLNRFSPLAASTPNVLEIG